MATSCPPWFQHLPTLMLYDLDVKVKQLMYSYKSSPSTPEHTAGGQPLFHGLYQTHGPSIVLYSKQTLVSKTAIITTL